MRRSQVLCFLHSGSSSKASFRSAQASGSGARRQGLGRGDQSLSMMPPNSRAQTHTPDWGSPRSENQDGLLPAVALRRLCSHRDADIPSFQTRQDPVTASVSPAQGTGRNWELTALINSPKRKASPLPPRNPGFLEGKRFSEKQGFWKEGSAWLGVQKGELNGGAEQRTHVERMGRGGWGAGLRVCSSVSIPDPAFVQMGLGAAVTYSKKSFPVANHEDDALGSLWALRRGKDAVAMHSSQHRQRVAPETDTGWAWPRSLPGARSICTSLEAQASLPRSSKITQRLKCRAQVCWSDKAPSCGDGREEAPVFVCSLGGFAVSVFVSNVLCTTDLEEPFVPPVPVWFPWEPEWQRHHFAEVKCPPMP